MKVLYHSADSYLNWFPIKSQTDSEVKYSEYLFSFEVILSTSFESE